MNADEVLQAYRGWLLKQAGNLVGSSRPSDVVDLAQEGWIAMWRALGTYDATRGALPAWLTSKARLRMLDCVARRYWTGTPSRRGSLTSVVETPLDWRDVPDASYPVELEVQLPDVEVAYHAGEVLAALNRLPAPHREYVYRCFWRGETHREATDRLGNRWSHAKRALRENLAHLRDLVRDPCEA